MSVLYTLQPPALTVALTASVRDVVNEMGRVQAGYALVLEQQRIVGLFTDRDVVKAIASGVCLETTAIADLLTSEIVCITEAELDDEAVVAERIQQTGYLPVINGQGQPVGVLAPGQLGAALLALQQTANTQAAALERAIAERQQLEIALADSEAHHEAEKAKLLSILNTARVSICSFRLFSNGDYVDDYYSQGCELLTGYSAEELLSQKCLWLSRILPDERDALWTNLVDNLLAERSVVLEYQFRHKDGSVRWFSTMFGAYREPEADYVTVTSVDTDITERKRIEDALRESEERFRQLAENIDEVFFIESPDGDRTLYVSPGYERIWGYSCQSLYNHPEDWIKFVHPSDRACIADSFNAQKQGNPTQKEYQIVCKDGSTRWIFSRTFPIFDEAGHLLRHVGVAEDITERKRAETRIRESLREKEALLQEIHHRVKNNLQIISSLLNLQANRVSDPQVRKILEDSWSRVDSMALVHENLYRCKDFSNIDLNQYIKTLILNLFHIYSIQPDRITHNITADAGVSLPIDQAIPCGLIINELVTNALKHGFQENKTGILSVSLSIQPTQKITLAVSNSGNTLPANFDLNTTQSMGMRLVMSLVEQLEGTLKIERGNLTTFSITFIAHQQRVPDITLDH